MKILFKWVSFLCDGFDTKYKTGHSRSEFRITVFPPCQHDMEYLGPKFRGISPHCSPLQCIFCSGEKSLEIRDTRDTLSHLSTPLKHLTAMARSSISSLLITPSPSRSYSSKVHLSFSSSEPWTRRAKPRTKSWRVSDRLYSLVESGGKFDLKYLKSNYFSVLLGNGREDIVRVGAHVDWNVMNESVCFYW